MTSLTYKKSGVDIEAGNALVNRIKPLAKSTQDYQVLGGLGGFAGLFQLDTQAYQEPVLVSSTDGVGTKLKLAIDCKAHRGLGIDLVAMCVNDIITTGAKPLFFLDYYATSRLDVDIASEVIEGIAEGCRISSMALIGGETAEMPGVYKPGDYDLAGFCVGIVEKQALITPQGMQEDSQLIALTSSGPHANGYSLIHAILEKHATHLSEPLGDKTIQEALLVPTRIYVNAMQALQEAGIALLGISHITGGGLLENIARMLPKTYQARIDLHSWSLPPIFDWLRIKGQLTQETLQTTFNCGAGLILSVPKTKAIETLAVLEKSGESPWVIGDIVSKPKLEADPVIFNGVL